MNPEWNECNLQTMFFLLRESGPQGCAKFYSKEILIRQKGREIESKYHTKRTKEALAS